MAKLGSSSCRPLLQGMMLLAVLLLLASIQAGPVMAQFGQAIEQFAAHMGQAKEFLDHGGEKAVESGEDHAIKTAATRLDKQGLKRESNVLKELNTFRKYSCKAQGWMEKLGGASGTPSFVDTLGGDVSRSLRTFSYYVNVTHLCWKPQVAAAVAAAAGIGSSTTLVPHRYPGQYYVQMKDILVGQDVFVGLTPMKAVILMSTTQGYTYLERTVYDRLTAVVKVQMSMLGAKLTSSPFTAEQLCYTGVELWRLPRITILLANNNAAMRPMELDGAAWDNQPSMFCLGILPATTEEPVLGTMIQSGKTMNIDLRGPGGLGTLTF